MCGDTATHSAPRTARHSQTCHVARKESRKRNAVRAPTPREHGRVAALPRHTARRRGLLAERVHQAAQADAGRQARRRERACLPAVTSRSVSCQGGTRGRCWRGQDGAPAPICAAVLLLINVRVLPAPPAPDTAPRTLTPFFARQASNGRRRPAHPRGRAAIGWRGQPAVVGHGRAGGLPRSDGELLPAGPRRRADVRGQPARAVSLWARLLPSPRGHLSAGTTSTSRPASPRSRNGCGRSTRTRRRRR